ncbi:glycoside hydrolase family 3 N-terminal domain-containing protein [Microbacterium sp. CIAB417]|uniref:glycoside hydrolase family 3 N-terminal domain-containing protein n=1 Tax=Microbacterium sp. CIAB417 TaxID=2860287 RepID=UPI001FABF8A0|nr:glycoside hydrolase family 3 N-terminal domain-containing protein [Microbacterium sp. CIAB417]
MTGEIWRDPRVGVEARVDALVAELTREEKVAQLGGYWADQRTGGEIIAPMQDVFSEGRAPFERVVRHGIGQLTRVFGTAPVSARDGMTRIRDAQQHLLDAMRVAIPAIVHEECLTGFTTLGATVYPTALAWGATFDPELVGEMARAIGRDMSAVGVHQGLSPVLDVVTDYRWGRVEETMGEDPYVVATLASAYVEGLQNSGVIATLKHFAGHASSRGGRNHAPVAMGERELRDLVLPPFEMAVRLAGARSVMNSYTETDRVPAAADRWLLTDLLRGEWGFDGTVVSDYWAVAFLKSKHGLAGTMPEAGRLALHAGLDVELPDISAFLVLDDEDPDPERTAADIDTALRRVLRQKIQLGLLDQDWKPAEPVEHDLDSPANRDIARRMAEKSIVLLDNPAALLPLAPATSRIAVIGPCAADPSALMGAYSFPVHVLPRHPGLGPGVPAMSLPDALRASFPGAGVAVQSGCPLQDPGTAEDLARAVDAATHADVAIVVVGDHAGMFGKGTSGEGSDAASLDLPGDQGDLVDAILATGTPVVLVVLSGRPYALGRFVGRGAAVLQAFMPGVEGAGALARILAGEVNPSGHLPVQVPRSSAALPHTYLAPPLGQDGDRISNLSIAPAFPFGHGLSYTTFEIVELAVDHAEIATDGTVTATVTIANTGEREGETVVQLYSADPVAQVTRPVQQLVGYARIAIEAGQCTQVAFTLHADRFSFTGLSRRRIVEAGEVVLSAGFSVGDLARSRTVMMTGETREVVDPVLRTEAHETRSARTISAQNEE